MLKYFVENLVWVVVFFLLPALANYFALWCYREDSLRQVVVLSVWLITIIVVGWMSVPVLYITVTTVGAYWWLSYTLFAVLGWWAFAISLNDVLKLLERGNEPGSSGDDNDNGGDGRRPKPGPRSPSPSGQGLEPEMQTYSSQSLWFCGLPHQFSLVWVKKWFMECSLA